MSGAQSGQDRRIRVRAPARLHLGFLDLQGGLGRRFGSIGLSIDEPATELDIAPAAELQVFGPESDRLRQAWQRAAELYGVPAGAAIRVHCAIPAHAGFGSGTQLSLAAMAGLARLHGRPMEPGAARALDRGARSGIGIASFFDGGLIVDGGRSAATLLPPVLARLPFPEAWRILLILDPGIEGVHGAAEREAFATLPAFPETDADRICRIVLMQVLPAAAEADLPAFSAGIAEIQRRIGDHFAPAQGGRYASPRVAATMAAIEAMGITGIGQSSWGPTSFALIGSEAEALDVVQHLRRPGVLPPGLEVLVARGRNHGAEIDEFAAATPLRSAMRA